MTPSEMKAIHEKAAVPEHSVRFMAAMSGGEPFLVGSYMFIAAEDWLLAVGYPLENNFTPKHFEQAILAAAGESRVIDSMSKACEREFRRPARSLPHSLALFSTYPCFLLRFPAAASSTNH
jgi:hypothetical protein